MLNVHLDEEKGIVSLEPIGKLSKDDFAAFAAIIDPYIEKTGKLNGLIIHVKSFPGWDSFAALVRHLKFIKNHHQKVSCVAFVTDSPIGNFAEHVASHFINATIKHFSFDRLEDARKWIAGSKK
ncbi:MAG: STAS/SEC14 domain-containing protein [Victivallales bacterium]|nr:STAS/SEC14 domain-containing protein [Victivallales bacterium]